jgi:hypothetical protein
MLLSKLTSGAAKPPTHLEEVLSMGPVQPSMMDRLVSAWFHTMSVLQGKPRCPLDGSAPWVAPSLSAVSHCASVRSYYLVRVLENMNCYLPH